MFKVKRRRLLMIENYTKEVLEAIEKFRPECSSDLYIAEINDLEEDMLIFQKEVVFWEKMYFFLPDREVDNMFTYCRRNDFKLAKIKESYYSWKGRGC